MTSTSPHEIPSGIRGVSERRRDPRLGKIRLGRREPNKAPCRQHAQGLDLDCSRCTHPVASPFFVFPDDAPGRRLRALFGDACDELPIAFPSDDAADFARRNLESWGAGTLKCRGNGVEALALVDVEQLERWRAAIAAAGGEIIPPPRELWATTARAGAEARRQREGPEPERRLIPCLGLGYDGAPPCPKLEAGDCSPSAHLQVIVRGYPGLGIFQIDTGSVVNVSRVDDFLAYLARYTAGRFAMLPLVMRLAPYEMRGRTFFGLTFDVDLAAIASSALPSAAQLSIPERVLAYLPEPTRRPPAAADVAEVLDDGPPADAGAAGDVLDEPPPDDDAPLDLALEEDVATAGGTRPQDPHDASPRAQRDVSLAATGDASRHAAAQGDGSERSLLAELGEQLHPLLHQLGGAEPMDALLRRLVEAARAGDERAAFASHYVARADSGRVVLRLGGREEAEIRELAAALAALRQDWAVEPSRFAADVAADALPR